MSTLLLQIYLGMVESDDLVFELIDHNSTMPFRESLNAGLICAYLDHSANFNSELGWKCISGMLENRKNIGSFTSPWRDRKYW